MIKESADNGDYLVQVSAQVMTLDDSIGGWVPMGGGGLSRVRLCKLSPPDSSSYAVCGGGGPSSDSSGNTLNTSEQISDANHRTKVEYVIQGERISDNSKILDCRLKKDIQYTKPNPKWHHWKTDEKRYGLTFERTEDAKAFDHGIRIAVADLTEGMADGPTEGEEIFSYMDLPLLRKDSSSRSASTTSTTTSSPGTNSPPSSFNNNNNNSNNNDPFGLASPHTNHLHRVHPLHNPQSRGVHQTNGGSVFAGHHHYQNPHPHRQQQQHQLHKHHLQLHLEQHHNHQQQLLKQQQRQIHDYQNLPQQVGFSPPGSGNTSPARCSLDSSTSPLGQDLQNIKQELEEEEVWVKGGKPTHPCLQLDDCGDYFPSKESSYVIFNKNGGTKGGGGGGPPQAPPHEYSYPNLEPAQKPPTQRSSTKRQALGPAVPHSSSSSTPSPQPYPTASHLNNPPLPLKAKSKSKSSSSSGSGGSGSAVGLGILSGGTSGSGDAGKQQTGGPRCRLVSTQVQCKHCRELFSQDENPRGSCEDAPDAVERCLECVSCVTCAQCLMYHCCADADGEFGHPCSCNSSDPGFCKRWTALSLLSLLLPCLWCYFPLKACHHCGTTCGLCGGRHKAA